MRTDPSRNLETSRLEDRNLDNTVAHCLDVTDLPFKVPKSVLADIVPITDPKLSYSAVYAQRERRIRLLIRRYTNQVQYGCRNVNCTVPTCLSYRKRNSKTPLRKYTELSARSLACRLVEDFTDQGKDPSSGLCWNEPVVPWYEDGREVQKRHEAAERAAQRYSSHEQNGSLVEGHGLHHPKDLNGAKTPNSFDSRSPTRGKNRKSRDTTTRRRSWPTQTSSDRDDTKKQEVEQNENGSTPPTETECPPEVLQSVSKKDFASMIQCLYDLRPLRLLSWLPTSQVNQEVGEEISEVESSPRSPSPEIELDPQDEDHAESNEHFQGTTSCGYTLNRLTWSSLNWLTFINGQPDVTTPFEEFLRQSLLYCLGNPKRLLNSAKTWTEWKKEVKRSATYVKHDELWSTIFREENEKRNLRALQNEIQQGIERQNQCPKKVRNSLNLANTISAFSTISQLRSPEEMLDALYTGLQQTFTFPRRSSTSQNQKLLLANGNLNDGRVDSPDERERETDKVMNDRPSVKSKSKNSSVLSDEDVSEVCFLTLVACISICFDERAFLANRPALDELSRLRNTGLVYPRVRAWPRLEKFNKPEQKQLISAMVSTIDVCEDWYVLRLISSTMSVIGHQLAMAEIKKSQTGMNTLRKPRNVVERMMELLGSGSIQAEMTFNTTVSVAMVELLRTVMLKIWDRKPIIRRNSPTGGALELLAGMYRQRKQLNLEPSTFFMPFVAEAFDDIEMPSEWLSFRADGRQTHVLSFSFLFEPSTLVKYFRAINIETMRKCHENALMFFNNARQFLTSTTIPVYGRTEVLAAIRPQIAQYFVLTIRRDNVLADAINQIWRRQRREIMRPLRVRLGKDEGEDGLDHGGVQQEFFRVVFAEALQPEYGMFSVDDRTRMTWFQPGSLEPLYKFEALGVLMSLAVYNAVTLPITFPLAFYRKLLGLKVKTLDHINDGWPDLTKGLETLLDWSDGDVGDVIGRTYEFSYEILGTTVTVDMQKFHREDPWPPNERSKKGKEKAKTTSFELPIDPQFTPPVQPSPALSPEIMTGHRRSSSIDVKGVSTPLSMESDMLDEAALVTNDNRDQYVKDYVFWLTDKSVRAQYEAFAQGFYTCLDRTALSLFTAEALKQVVEGHDEIDIDELERTTTYDEFEKTSQTIVDFWQVVRSFSPEQHQKLLEFVTASSRIPVNGMSSIQFTIQKNGDDNTRLPSSSTCYGRLLLPQYSSRTILEEKLSKAIENSVGFGAL